MTTASELLDALADSALDRRLVLYEKANPAVTAEELRGLAKGLAVMGWLTLRLEAGPPGRSLPSVGDAGLHLRTESATLADAAAIWLHPGGAATDEPTLLRHLARYLELACQAGAGASRDLLMLYFALLATRAGAVAEARLQLEALRPFAGDTDAWQRANDLLEPLATDPVLREAPWVRVAAASMWASLDIPAAAAIEPSFDDLLQAASTSPPVPVLQQLLAIDHPLGRALGNLLTHLRDRGIREQLAEDPTVLMIVRAAWTKAERCDPGLPIPPGLRTWALAVGRAGDLAATRLAGWLLHDAGQLTAEEMASMAALAVRASDLEFLAKHARDGDQRMYWLDLYRSLNGLPGALADAVLATCVRRAPQEAEVELCVQERDVLAAAVPTMGQHTREMVEALLHILQMTVDDRAAAELVWPRFLAIAATFDPTHGSPPKPVEPLTIGLLELAAERTRVMSPRQALRVALLLVHWLPGQGHPLFERVFAEQAVHAIVAAEEVNLLPRAASLIDWLLVHGGVRHTLAELRYYQVKIAMPELLRAPKARLKALRVLDDVVRSARGTGSGWCEVKASCLWITISLLDLPVGPARAVALANATAVLDAAESAALAWEMLPELCSERARILTLGGDVEGGVEAWRRAIAHTEPDRHLSFRADLLGNLAQSLLFSHRPGNLDEAEAAAREALACLPPDSGASTTAFTRGILGHVLALHRKETLDEAIVLLEDTLRVPLQRLGLTHPATLRLALVLAYKRKQQLAVARHHLDVVLAEHADLEDVVMLLDAAGRATELDTVDGQDSARALVERLWRRHIDSPWQPILELLRTLATDLRPAAPLAHAYIVGELPHHPVVDSLLRQAIDRQVEVLPRSLLAACLERGFVGPEHLHLRGKIYIALRQTQELRDEFERLLAGPQTEADRATCLAFVCATLRRRDPRRRAALDELETLVLQTGQSHLRAHLASILLDDYPNDPSVLRRAAGHAEAACRADPEDDALWQLQASIRAAQMTAHGVESSLRAVEIAAWFAQEIPLPRREVDAMRVAMVRQLLYAGPLTHPAALDLADTLIARIASGEADELLRRLVWIRRQRGASDGSSPVTGARSTFGPLDEAPAWLIDLVVDRPPTVPHVFQPDDGPHVIRAALVRSDRASDLLSWVVEQAGDALPELVPQIASVPTLGRRDAVGPRLLALLAELLQTRPSFELRKLEVLLLQSSQVWGDGTPYEQSASALLASAETPAQTAEALFFKGVERLEAHQVTQAGATIQAAREHLTAAGAIAASHGVSRFVHFSILVSSGNAARRGEDADPGKALAFYEEAARIGADSEHEEARLAKVRADAMVERGTDVDVREALGLLEHALRIRDSGWLRAETLLSAHRAELACKDRPPLERTRRALARLEEAVEHDDGTLVEPLLQLRLRLLDRLLNLSPSDVAARRRLEDLAAQHPEVARIVHIILLRHQFPSGVSLDHPVAVELAQYTFGINAQMRHSLGELAADGPSPVEWARDQLECLAPAIADEGRPGLLAARALLCAYLCETGDVDPGTARAAAEAAATAASTITEAWVQAFILGELSRAFAPDSNWAHPFHDFRRAAELCERGLALDGLPDATKLDLLGYLARATRYRTDGDIHAHLVRAEELYEHVLAMHQAAGQELEASRTRANLAELRAALQRGGESTARRSEIDALRSAILAAGEGGLAIDRAGLARELTQLGSSTPGDAGTALLREGETHFAALPWDRMNPGLVESSANYRTICLAELAVREGDVQRGLGLWRTRLDGCDRARAPAAWAMAAHNLADLLLRVGGPVGVREAFVLCTAALAIRTPESILLHHWETAFQLGQTAAALLDAGNVRREVVETALAALDSGLAAATALGGGDRRFRTGISLLRISLHTPGAARLESLAVKAWGHINAGRVALIADGDAARLESDAALAVAEVLADRLAERGVVGIAEGCTFVLGGEDAARVLPWMVRAAGCAQRRLTARMYRPDAVPHAIWVAWLTAVHGGLAGDIARALERVQVHAPEFLGGEPDLDGLTQWLGSHPHSAAIVVLRVHAGYLAAVLDWHDGLRVRVARLSAPPPPCDEAALARNINLTGYSDMYIQTGRWADEHVTGPLRRLAPERLRHLLWLPAGPLRMLSPMHLWPGVAVSLAVDPFLRAWPQPLQSRVAMVVADTASTIPGVVSLTTTLATLAAEIGPTRVRLSRGALWGSHLATKVPGMVDGPADANGLLCEVAEAEVVVLMCHGRAGGPDDAELEVTTVDGSPETLTIQAIAANPRRVKGQTFILLSCETGRTGTWIHQAGGLAGALLACGARYVLAPLWPVQVHVACEVGAAALRALAAGRDLAELLAAPGRERSAADDISRVAFVLWMA
ncbi:MAG: CHAT domain-containing protein [Nannocystis sp.]|nr:CHAT domain-containing protein [Nannocystis sp.]MBA3546789.1 CHAT domain-containing protein [Nannocystis sp.]